MNKNIKRAALAAALAGTLLLSGCGNDAGQGQDRISVVRDDTGAEYKLTPVRQGPLTLNETVRVTYFAASTANYGFGETGVYYDKFLVSVGDEVKAGDVLGILDCTALDADITEKETTIEELTRSLERNRSLLTLFDERQGDEALSAANSATRRGYEKAIQEAEGEIAIVSTELSTLKTQKEGRIITADIDGTVTFVREVQNGETSVNGRVVFTITDLSSCAFSAAVEHPESLSAEEIYTIAISGVEYDIRLTTAEALGIEAEPMNEKSKLTRVYFEPVTPSVNLTEGDGGSFSVVVEHRDSTIYVPSTTLTVVDGAPSVYVLDENGLMSARNVEVGLTTNRYTEILSGLDAGEDIVQY